MLNGSQKKKRERKGQKTYDEIMTGNLPKLGKETDIHIQETQKSPKKMTLNKSTRRHTIIKMSKVKWGTQMAQLVKCPTSAQVVISQLVSSSPTSGSVLTTQSLEPAPGSVFPSLSAPPLLVFCLSLKKKQT